MNEIKRVCIYPKDVMRITGKSERASRKLLDKIKAHLNKEKHHFVTVAEFSGFTGLNLTTVENYIKD
jgi:hypothetical protein